MLKLKSQPASEVEEVAFANSYVRCALEDEDFPFELISEIAEAESWRKEINRPTYHIHKWWARRLGTIFRAILIGALSPAGTEIMQAFYRPVRFKNTIVFDPFMGSGTTVGEALKLGARVIGRDINPVAHFLVRNALARHDRSAVIRTFREIERDTAERIKPYYRTDLEEASDVEVLYFFWVKQANCPECNAAVDLFPTRVFAKHTNPRKNPSAHCTCPNCNEVNPCRYDAVELICGACSMPFNPQTGTSSGQRATCPHCSQRFSIAKAIRESSLPPSHRMYAKLVLMPDGRKVYAAATESDLSLYERATQELAERENAYPRVSIKPGYNTDQVLGYNYRHWHEMFNDRQLLCLSILAERIREISEPSLRELFACLFSGTLEFNNMFASYKGEGTGAVRHMFAHHILKPERVPLEANVWGTSKSSGSFLTMFKRRICRALDYADDPFELRVCNEDGRRRTDRVYGLSQPMSVEIASNLSSFEERRQVYLSCGDSSHSGLRTGSVDAVITDPPFFDNVHYSQLADIFHVWQCHILGSDSCENPLTTRSDAEVQHGDVDAFSERLANVWAEVHRVLADEGVLAFTYHHSRSEGWRSILRALMVAGFRITAAVPVKSEMSVAMPKLKAKEPIDLDVIIVCRKCSFSDTATSVKVRWNSVRSKSAAQIQRFQMVSRSLSQSDVRVIVMAQLIAELSRSDDVESAVEQLDTLEPTIEQLIEVLHSSDTPAILDLAS